MEWTGILFFFSVLGYAMLLMLALPKIKTGHALLSAVCGMLAAAYYSVIILGWMAAAAWVLMCGGLAGLAAGAVCAAMNVRGLRKRLCSPGMLVFALLCVYMALGAPGCLVRNHDDLSYWARAVKELYTFDTFYIHGDSTMFHMDYIPLLAALQYCVVRVFGWQDASLYFVTGMCMAASIAALAEFFPKRRVAAVMAVLLVYACQVYGFEFFSLRADDSMMLVFTASLLCLLVRRDDSWASLLPPVLACAALAGFKIYSGLMFGAVIVIGMVIEWVYAVRKKQPWKKLAAAAAVSVTLLLALQVSWSVLYNYSSAMAWSESIAAADAYAGRPAAAAGAGVSLGQLLSGNPRTAQLMHSFTPENIENFLQLAAGTMEQYFASNLVWAWLFLIPAAALCFTEGGRKRAAAVKTILLLVLAALIYLLGLFGSYFVQSETSGAALVYLSTVSAPLVIAGLFLTVWLGQEQRGAAAAVLTALMTGGMVLLCPPAELLPRMEPREYSHESALAVDFYEYDMDGLLTEADAGKRALLIENSYQATEVTSRSGKTHAYAYFGLPVRVLEPIYYTYGDYTQLDTFDAEELRQRIIDSRCDLLILRVEDFLYWDAICEALELYGEWDDSIGVYDVTYENGGLSFAFRLPEDEEEW